MIVHSDLLHDQNSMSKKRSSINYCKALWEKSAGLSQYFVEKTGSIFLETYVRENCSKITICFLKEKPALQTSQK